MSKQDDRSKPSSSSDQSRQHSQSGQRSGRQSQDGRSGSFGQMGSDDSRPKQQEGSRDSSVDDEASSLGSKSKDSPQND